MRVSAIEGHSLWAPTYDSGPNPLLALECRTINGLLHSRAPARLIDIACGTGRWMLQFRKFGTRVLGVDACREMLAEAEKHSSLRGRVALADARTLPFRDGVTDLALCSFAAAYIRDFPRALVEMARVCVRGACVVVSDMHPLAAAEGWSRSFRIGTSIYELDHANYSIDELRAAGAAAGLNFERHFDAHFDEPEQSIFVRAGKQHSFAALKAIPAVWVGIWSKP